METKPGYKTTEFWMCFAADVFGAAAASGAFPEGGWPARVLGIVTLVLATVGYTCARAWTKAKAS